MKEVKCGVSNRPGPLILENLTMETDGDAELYDVKAVDPNVIVAYLDSGGGGRCEWYDDKLIRTYGSEYMDIIAGWIHFHLRLHMRFTGWSFLRTTHVVGGNNRWFIPSVSARYEPDRPKPAAERQHPMLGRTLPHIAAEVEWADLVDRDGKGFHKMRNYLFQLEGTNNTYIEEGWVISVPHPLNAATASVAVEEFEQEACLPAQADTQRPPPELLFLATMRRTDSVMEYYRLEANRTFRLPPCSLLSAAGPVRPPGLPDLPINQLLRELGFPFA